MSDSGQSISYSVEELVGDIKIIVAERGVTEIGLGEITEKMQELAKRPDLFELGDWRPTLVGFLGTQT